MAHNFRNEVRKLNLITSLRPNGSASGRMTYLFQDFQFDDGNHFFIFNPIDSICKNLKNMIYYIKIIEGGSYERRK